MKQGETPGFLKTKHGIALLGGLDPSQILVGGFLVVILLGTLILMLPISSQAGTVTPFVDSLFTATSAVCVTGLSVVTTAEHWSLFGQVVILLCIQIGGLGFMSIVSMLFIITRKRISLKNRLIMQEALSYNTPAGIVRFTKYIVEGTLLVEGIGALLLAFVFVPEYDLIKGIWYAVFHSISAFCNAGFDLIGGESLMPYVGNTLMNMTIMLLIIISGLGFSVWVDTYNTLKYKFMAKKEGRQACTWRQAFYKLALHTKLVLIITAILLVLGFVFFFCAEYTNPQTLGGLGSLKEKIYAAMFQSVTPRTAGFCTISLADLTDASKVMTILLMFIGGSPAGTAGGIKTVTVGVLILCAISTIKGEEHTTVFKRTIPMQIIARALTLIMILLSMIMVTITILSFTETFEFMDILFEVVSAYGTVGVTLGITPSLSLIGRIVIIIAMFIGRLGPITIAVALTIKQNRNKANVKYPEEKILVG